MLFLVITDLLSKGSVCSVFQILQCYILSWIIVCFKLRVGRLCPVHCGVFSIISDFYPLDANNTPTPAVTAKTVPRRGQMSPCGGGR